MNYITGKEQHLSRLAALEAYPGYQLKYVPENWPDTLNQTGDE